MSVMDSQVAQLSMQCKTYKDALQPAELDHFAFLLYFSHFLLVFLQNKNTHANLVRQLSKQHKQTKKTKAHA
jgi:hypothetical protein